LRDNWFKFLKSTNNWISPFFFLTTSKFATQDECLVGATIFAISIFWTSFWMSRANFVLIFLNFFLKGFAPCYSEMGCWMISSLYALISSHDHAKTSLYSLNRILVLLLSSCEVLFPILTSLGFSTNPMFISNTSLSWSPSYFFLYISCLLKILASGTTPWGILLFGKSSIFISSSSSSFWPYQWI